MNGLLIRWFINGLSLLLASYLVPGIVVESILYALVAAVVLGMINALVRPVLILLTLPLTIFTFGFFILVINALLLWMVSSLLGDGFVVQGFWSAFFGALIISVIGWLTSTRINERGRMQSIDLRKDKSGKWR